MTARLRYLSPLRIDRYLKPRSQKETTVSKVKVQKVTSNIKHQNVLRSNEKVTQKQKALKKVHLSRIFVGLSSIIRSVDRSVVSRH